MPRKHIDNEFDCGRLCSRQIAPEGATAAASVQRAGAARAAGLLQSSRLVVNMAVE